MVGKKYSVEIAEEISSGEEEGETGRISAAEIQDLLTMWSKTQEVVEKWHPDRALVNRCVNLFNDIQHFRKIKKGRQHQSTLERWLSTKISDPKPSTSGERLRYETAERIPDVIMKMTHLPNNKLPKSPFLLLLLCAVSTFLSRLKSSMEWLTDNVSSIFPSVTLTILICFLIVVTCISGDNLLSVVSGTDWSGNDLMIRAITDSLTHAIVGALVWAVAENSGLLNDLRRWQNCVFCAVLAALVDVDHFIAAKSLNLEKATSLTGRPYFHNTSLIPLIVGLCFMLRQYIPALHVFSLMILSSWLSHHLRDAKHRGLWLFPFGHTPTFSSYLYMALIVILALSVRVIYYTAFNTRSRNSSVVI